MAIQSKSELTDKVKPKNQEVKQQCLQENQQMIQNIADMMARNKSDAQQFKEWVLTIAFNLDKLHEIGEFVLPKFMICSTIIQMLEKKGLYSLRRNVYHYLEEYPHYRNHYDKSTREIVQARTNPTVESTILYEEAKHACEILLNTNLDQLAKRHIQDLIDLIADPYDRVKKYADENKIASIDKIKDSTHDALKENEKQDDWKKVINHIEKDNYHEGPATEILDELMHNLKLFRDKVAWNYPYSFEKPFVKAWKVLVDIIRTWADDKWKEDRYGWVKILDERKYYSVHAMESRTKHKLDNGQELPGLTKEQIQDNEEKMRQFVIDAFEGIPFLFETIRYFNWKILPRRRKLTKDNHPKLSHSG